MHPYATESEERARIYWFLAITSLVIAWLVHGWLGAIGLETPWSVDIPTTPIAVYWLLVWLFDTRLWKAPVLKRLSIVTIPNIEGNWIVEGVSSPDRAPVEWTGTVIIRQTWTGLSIVQETKGSISYSTSASLGSDEGRGTKLVHQYRNEPKVEGAVPSMHMHYGTSILTINEKGDRITGEYYSGRGRERYGHFTYVRK